MSKKIKPLDALKEIENSLKNSDNLNLFNICNLKIIKTALKRYELIFIEFNIYPKLANTEKKLKALEIIKEKNVHIPKLRNSSNLEEYNRCFRDKCLLTQEEYDLLKEVLL